MHKKISLLLLLSTSLVISADHHALKDDKSNKKTKKMEMEKRGMWKPEDCKKISQTSGAYLYFSGEVLDIDGVTGGFNFQNAWTGSWVASENL